MLPTNQLYKLMSLTEYNEAKQVYIKATASNYHDKSVAERWDIVMERMKKLAPEMDEKFENFRKTRKETDASLFNLSLADCLNYFENFAFLYETKDERFKLSVSERKKLLEAVDDAMGTCETGISTRFETVLQQFRTDLNWVTNLLSKFRYQLIIGIQDGYNEKYHVGDALKTHTLKRMTYLASDTYGVPIEHTMTDVYAHLTDRNQIASYFNRNAPRVFTQEYEETIVEMLAQDLLSQIQKLYCPDEFNWDEEGLVIPASDVSEFCKFVMGNRLGLSPEVPYSVLGTLDDEDEMDGRPHDPTYSFTLKNKGETLELLRELVTKKLIKEKYFVPFDEVTNANIKNIKDVRLRGIELYDLVQLNEAMLNSAQNPAAAAKLLQRHSGVILNYPELFLGAFEKNPKLLNYLPRTLKNNEYFLEKIIPIVDKLLVAGVEDSEELTRTFLRLFKNRQGLVDKLSPELLRNDKFVYALLQQDGLALCSLDEPCKGRELFVEAAVRQNPLALLGASSEQQKNPHLDALALQSSWFKSLGWNQNFPEAIPFVYTELHEQLPYMFKSSFDAPHFPFPVKFMNNPQLLNSKLEAMRALSHLSNHPGTISIGTVARMSQFISPEELQVVISFRSNQGYPSLPYCPNAGAIEHFTSSLKEQGVFWNNWIDDAPTLRMTAAEHMRFNHDDDAYGDSATSLFANNQKWFLAMVQHQQNTTGAFKTFKQFWLKLKPLLDQTAALIYEAAKFLLFASLGITLSVLANHVVFTLLPAWAVLALCVFAISPLFAPFFNSRAYTMASTVLSMISGGILFLGQLLIVGTAVYGFIEIIKLAGSSFEVLGTGFSLLSRGLQTLFGSSDPVFQNNVDLRGRCENSITRLELNESVSAQEKADVMRSIFDKIDQEVSISTDLDGKQEKEFATRLSKQYPVELDGKARNLSFFEVAAISRSNSTPFDLDKPKSSGYFSFFRTATTNMLPDERDVQRTYGIGSEG
jgi:hypothetical protein